MAEREGEKEQGEDQEFLFNQRSRPFYFLVCLFTNSYLMDRLIFYLLGDTSEILSTKERDLKEISHSRGSMKVKPKLMI